MYRLYKNVFLKMSTEVRKTIFLETLVCTFILTHTVRQRNRPGASLVEDEVSPVPLGEIRS